MLRTIEIIRDYLPHILSTLLCGVISALLTLHWLYGISFRSKDLMCINNQKLSKTVFPNRFKVLSQNTWCAPFVGGRKTRQRLNILIRKIKEEQPDFICIQELFLFSLCGILILCGDLYFANKELSKLGYIICGNPKASLPKLFGFNSGLMLYSNIAAESCGSFDYSATHLPFPKSVVCRGLIYAIYKVHDGDKLLVLNTHFENAVREAKLSEIKDLAHFLHTNLKCNDIKYVMVMGDFNICSNGSWEPNIDKDQRLYTVLYNTLSNCCGLKYDVFGECERSFRYEVTERPNAVYDHMFINENLKKSRILHEIKDWKESGLVMSDHFGLMGHFDLLR